MNVNRRSFLKGAAVGGVLVATGEAWNEDGPVAVGRTEDGWSAVTVKTCRGILIEGSAK